MALPEQKINFDASTAHVEMGPLDEKIDTEGLEQGALNQERFDAVDKQLTRKLDCTLMPIVWLLYLFNYLDRNNIA